MAASSEEAIGAMKAIQDAGKVPGKDIIIITADNSQECDGYLEEGLIAGCVSHDSNFEANVAMAVCRTTAFGRNTRRTDQVYSHGYDYKGKPFSFQRHNEELCELIQNKDHEPSRQPTTAVMVPSNE